MRQEGPTLVFVLARTLLVRRGCFGDWSVGVNITLSRLDS